MPVSLVVFFFLVTLPSRVLLHVAKNVYHCYRHTKHKYLPNLESKKIAGKLQPTEVFLKKKNGSRVLPAEGTRYVESIKIGLAEELGIFWNNYAYVSQTAAREQIDFLSKLTPTIPPWQQEEASTETLSDLDTPDELAVRSFRTLGDFATSRIHLTEAYDLRVEVEVSTWAGGLLDLTEMDALDQTKD
ncbi:hypothetical protein F5887DRAFT_1188535 [Amanita rubescens]|nr:hypothetical protein F5887DRAFT_1188535 [Amanita rubescens]